MQSRPSLVVARPSVPSPECAAVLPDGVDRHELPERRRPARALDHGAQRGRRVVAGRHAVEQRRPEPRVRDVLRRDRAHARAHARAASGDRRARRRDDGAELAGPRAAADQADRHDATKGSGCTWAARAVRRADHERRVVGTAASTRAIAMFASSAKEGRPSARHRPRRRRLDQRPEPLHPRRAIAERPIVRRGGLARGPRARLRPANGAPVQVEHPLHPGLDRVMSELVTYWVSEIACSTARTMFGPVTRRPCGSPASTSASHSSSRRRTAGRSLVGLPAPAGVRDDGVDAGHCACAQR